MVYVIQVCWQLASRIRTELVPSWSCSQAVSKFLLDPARKLSASSVLILLASCQQVPSWSCSQAVSKIVWHIPLLCVQWKTPDDGQRNSPKQVEFYSKNKFEKLVHLVGFIIRIKGKTNLRFFYVLLTVHLSIILVINQLDAQNIVL